jgi:glutaminyl-tRNA synthetase
MITSKRKLLKLVEEGYVSGWDDPRMPTISGLRRKGFPAAAIRAFCDKIGVAKRENLIEIELLESCVREDLNKNSQRAMVVTNPIKVTLQNYSEGKTEFLNAENNPENTEAGHRSMSFSRNLYIEQEDFMIDPPKGYFRLYPGGSVRLKHAYIITCEEAVTDENGEVIELICTYHENSKSGEDTSGIKVKGTLHWVNQDDAIDCEIRQYERLFVDPSPASHEDKEVTDFINPQSLTFIPAKAEVFLTSTEPGNQYQFLRKGYYTTDIDSTSEKLVFNTTIGLKDSYKKG